MLSEVTSYHHALQTVVFRVALVAHMTVRTKNRALGQGAAQAFGYLLLGEPAVSAKGHVQVIVFTMNGYRFNGSKVDRQFSYFKINAALSCNNYEEWQMQQQPQSYQKEISPFSRCSNNLIEGSLGLLSPSNMPEEQQPYDPYLKNKKKKKQRKINW